MGCYPRGVFTSRIHASTSSYGRSRACWGARELCFPLPGNGPEPRSQSAPRACFQRISVRISRPSASAARSTSPHQLDRYKASARAASRAPRPGKHRKLSVHLQVAIASRLKDSRMPRAIQTSNRVTTGCRSSQVSSHCGGVIVIPEQTDRRFAGSSRDANQRLRRPMRKREKLGGPQHFVQRQRPNHRGKFPVTASIAG